MLQFGTLSSFEKKLLPLKISRGSNQRSGDFENVDDMFEEQGNEEDVGWTSSFLRSKFKEDNKCLKYLLLLALS